MNKIKIKNETLDLSNFKTIGANDTINIKIFNNNEVTITTREIFDESSILKCHNIVQLHNHSYCDKNLVAKLREAGVVDGTEFIMTKDIYLLDVNKSLNKHINFIKPINVDNKKINISNFRFNTNTSRGKVLVNINQRYPLILNNEDEQYYYPYNVTVWDKDILVAEIVGIAFNEDLIEEHDIEFGEVACYISLRIGKIMDILANHDLYKSKIDPDYWYLPTHSSFISQIYINPVYSECGIADYIFKNLYEILQYSFNINMRCFIVQAFQSKKDEQDIWCRDYDEQMSNVIKRAIEKAGYTELAITGLYAINCMRKKEYRYE